MGNDNRLFQEIKAGKKQSFEQLFRAYYSPLCVFAHRFIDDADDCEEVVQDFFLKIWEKRNEIDITTSVKSYLFGSVRNRCFNYLKHQKIKQQYQNNIIHLTDSDSYQSNEFLEIDLIEKINRCIAELPDRRREIFVLNREKGLKYREIADQLGISIKTVETQMGHALRELREKLKDYRQLLISFLIIKKQLIREICKSGVKSEKEWKELKSFKQLK